MQRIPIFVLLIFCLSVGLHGQEDLTQISTQDAKKQIKEAIKEIEKFKNAIEKDKIRFEQRPVATIIVKDLEYAKADLKMLKNENSLANSRFAVAHAKEVTATLLRLNKQLEEISIANTAALKAKLSTGCSKSEVSKRITFITEAGSKEIKDKYHVWGKFIRDEDPKKLANGKKARSSDVIRLGEYVFWVEHKDRSGVRVARQSVKVECHENEIYFEVPKN